MPNILSIMGDNARRVPITLRFPEKVKRAKRYRGLVKMDPEKCLACGICDYVCVSSAIDAVSEGDHLSWTYDPGRCTFCGRCVRYCPGEALTQEEERPPAYEQTGALTERHDVVYPRCTSCGEPTLPFNEAMLRAAFDTVTEELQRKVRLCDRCRMRATQNALKQSFGARDVRRSDDEA